MEKSTRKHTVSVPYRGGPRSQLLRRLSRCHRALAWRSADALVSRALRPKTKLVIN
jgi:hypothetical protein